MIMCVLIPSVLGVGIDCMKVGLFLKLSDKNIVVQNWISIWLAFHLSRCGTKNFRLIIGVPVVPPLRGYGRKYTFLYVNVYEMLSILLHKPYHYTVYNKVTSLCLSLCIIRYLKLHNGL